jgi:hypothetical protein
MLATLLLMLQVAGLETMATCRVPDDPQQRTFSLARRDGVWVVVFRSRSLDQLSVELPIDAARVTLSPFTVSYKSANGGRSIEWTASTITLHVNHGLEVNIERDLDPAVDLMNTDGPLACEMGSGPFSGPQPQSVAFFQLAERDQFRTLPVNDTRPPLAEWTVAGGLARSVNLFQSTAGRSYAVQTIGWGRELTAEWGPGSVRGRFMWAAEAMPIFAQFSPSTIYGIGFAPVVWRWNFVPQPRWSAFAELAMGGMWSTEPIPEKTSRGNFTAHWGGGVRLRPRGPNALLVAYRFQHFSNGNQLGSNPGVNAHVVLVGWSYRS